MATKKSASESIQLTPEQPAKTEAQQKYEAAKARVDQLQAEAKASREAAKAARAERIAVRKELKGSASDRVVAIPCPPKDGNWYLARERAKIGGVEHEVHAKYDPETKGWFRVFRHSENGAETMRPTKTTNLRQWGTPDPSTGEPGWTASTNPPTVTTVSSTGGNLETLLRNMVANAKTVYELGDGPDEEDEVINVVTDRIHEMLTAILSNGAVAVPDPTFEAESNEDEDEE